MAQLTASRHNGQHVLHDTEHFALFSGGHDSLVATHKTMQSGDTNCVVHIDTGIGIPETKDYIHRIVDRFEWPYVELTSEHDYEKIVTENQFPGPAVHIIMYSKLKERALRYIPRQLDSTPHYYTGVRRSESETRFKEIDEPITEDPNENWIWHAPIHDYTERDIHQYLEDNDLPKSPVKQKYHHSGECLCGAFGDRTEELTLLEAHFPETAERIKDLETQVQAEHGSDTPRSYWAHGGMASTDLRALLAENDDKQMMLCQSCEANFPEE